MSKNYTWINVNYSLVEKCLVKFGFIFLRFIERNISFILLNALKIRYDSALNSYSYKLWSRILLAKFYIFESNLLESWTNELFNIKVGISSGEKILIQGPNLDFADLSDKEYDRVILLKPNHYSYDCRVTLLNNHASSHLAEAVSHEKFQFTFHVKSGHDIEYPEGTSNAFSLMGLQRAIYFCLKKLKVREIQIKGFDLYSKTTYNRELYPTLIGKSQEFDVLSESFFIHGLVGNFLFMKYLRTHFTIDSDVLEYSEDEYLQNVWLNLTKND